MTAHGRLYCADVSTVLQHKVHVIPLLVLGGSSDCVNFPLSQSIIDPAVNLFHPSKCGQLKLFDENSIATSGCFKDKTILIIGDSRARQVGGHLGILFNKTFDVEE